MLARTPLVAQNIREFWRSAAPPAALYLFLGIRRLLGAVFIIFAKLGHFGAQSVRCFGAGADHGHLRCALVVLCVRSFRLRDDQTGDNLYYMGFIFTLTSLAVALYQFEPNIGFDEIVRNFGVAVSSTITGITLRVIFNQMRQDPIEVEHSARQELAEASPRVRQQLDDTVIAFNHFHTQTIQSLEEAREELRKRLASQEANVISRATKSIEDSTARIGAAIQTFATAIDTASGQLGMEGRRGSRNRWGISTTRWPPWAGDSRQCKHQIA